MGKSILVTGATGKQGGAVIKNLLASPQAADIEIVAVTRNVSSPSAQKLAAIPNVKVIAGDFSDTEAIFEQAGPVWGLYSVQVNSDLEEAQGKAIIDSAVLGGVKHIVYSSGDRGGPERSPRDPTYVKNFAAKHAIEKHLEARAARAGLTYTILRPVSFSDNISNDMHGRGFARMWEQIGAAKKLQVVATKDIGYFAAQSFLDPEGPRWKNQAISLAGDELTQAEADRIFREVVGTPMPLAPCPLMSAVKYVQKGTIGDMFRWFEENGYGASVEYCREVNPEMQDFRAWLVENKGRWTQ